MRYLIYSDVHGNLPAFEAMLKEVGEVDVNVCLGDLVNYGPWSNECVDLALSLKNAVCLMGNHEEAFTDRFYPGSNVLVQTFFHFCIRDFKRFDEIRAFGKDYHINDYCLVHTINNEYIYPDTTVALDGNYIIGHSHHQFKYEYNGFALYNAGSVGQNRKYINVINYLLMDDETSEVEMKSLRYDADLIINEMRSRNYPVECIDYYNNKSRA